MAEYKIMVYRPTVFTVEAKNYEEAKRQILDNLIMSGQAKLSSPIIFQEIIDAEVTENKETEQKEEQAQDAE